MWETRRLTHPHFYHEGGGGGGTEVSFYGHSVPPPTRYNDLLLMHVCLVHNVNILYHIKVVNKFKNRFDAFLSCDRERKYRKRVLYNSIHPPGFYTWGHYFSTPQVYLPSATYAL